MEPSIEEKVHSLWEWRSEMILMFYGDEKKGIPSMVQTARMVERIAVQMDGIKTLAKFLGVTNVATIGALVAYIVHRGGL